MKRLVTILSLVLMAQVAVAQDVEHVLDIPNSDDFFAPYATGVQSGVRAVAGPFDMDGDGLMEFLATDYTGGGRVHVIENKGPNVWEHVYSTPWLDSTATTGFNLRYAYATNASNDLDGDGHGEILLPTGRRFSATNPNYAGRAGLYVFEHTGADDDYGTAPASILDLPEYPRMQAAISVEDVDKDGINELIISNNVSSANDFWYVYTVTGDIGSQFETWNQEFALNPRDNGNAHGGGSTIANWPIDLNGDGQKELLLHSWNNYNWTIARITGPDTYEATPGNNFKATNGFDEVAYAGGTIIDINNDGDEELYANNYSGNGDNPAEAKLTIVNFEAGEDIAAPLTADQIKIALLEDIFPWGLTSGDLDNDGQKEVIGVGYGFGAADYEAGNNPTFARMAEFIGGDGGDPEDPANYVVSDLQADAEAFRAGFHRIEEDSAGTTRTFYRSGGIFAFRAAYLGDADGDGQNELALGFQSVLDSVDVIDRVWNADSTRYDETVRERMAASARPFAAVMSVNADGVATADRLVLPSDYKLSGNYPNPFNPTTSFDFTLPIDKTVSVRVYDVAGRLVKTLINNQSFVAGTHQVSWDGTSDAGASVSSGTYLYTLEHGNFRQSRTMVLLK